ncbi:MAG: hypothetical protein GX995_07050, partial [Clostridiales bacterium]|nr:hypothetical protein [Clostridiales bacterium]
MAMEKEALVNKIEDDLARRNRNWDKIDDHLAESASKHIRESGSNANGSYIKFDDGTMICYISTTCDYTTTGAKEYTLPATFKEMPACSVSFQIGVDGQYRTAARNSLLQNSNTTISFITNSTAPYDSLAIRFLA